MLIEIISLKILLVGLVIIIVKPVNCLEEVVEQVNHELDSSYVSGTQTFGQNLFNSSILRKFCTSCFCPRSTIKKRIHFKSMFSKYWSYTKIINYLKYLADYHSHKVRLKRIATTVEKRTMYLVTVGLGFEGNNIIFVDGGLNARDWSSIMMALYIIYALVECDLYQSIGYVDWMIIPVANPDGYVYSFTHPKRRMWTKNKSPCNTTCSGDKGCGVNLNKNFPYMFSELGSSSNVCSNLYSGASPKTEIEVNAIVNLLTQHQDRIKVYLSLHSYGPRFTYPYAYTNILMHDAANLGDFGKRAIDEINRHSSYKDNYTIGNHANTIIAESGTSTDFAKGRLEIEYAYNIYLRGGFDPNIKEIWPIVSECFYGICFMAKDIYNKHPASKEFLRQWKGYKRRRENAAAKNTFSCYFGLNIAVFYFIKYTVLL